jgi:hypothetical protein
LAPCCHATTSYLSSRKFASIGPDCTQLVNARRLQARRSAGLLRRRRAVQLQRERVVRAPRRHHLRGPRRARQLGRHPPHRGALPLHRQHLGQGPLRAPAARHRRARGHGRLILLWFGTREELICNVNSIRSCPCILGNYRSGVTKKNIYVSLFCFFFVVHLCAVQSHRSMKKPLQLFLMIGLGGLASGRACLCWAVYCTR